MDQSFIKPEFRAQATDEGFAALIFRPAPVVRVRLTWMQRLICLVDALNPFSSWGNAASWRSFWSGYAYRIELHASKPAAGAEKADFGAAR